jgi:hypothetical protein
MYNNNWHNIIKISSFTILYQDENVLKWKDQIQKDFEKKMSTTRFKVLKITILKNQLYKRLKKAKKIKLNIIMRNIFLVFLTLKIRFY